MDYSLTYGESLLDIHLDDTVDTQVLHPKSPTEPVDADAMLKSVLEGPRYNGKSFEEAISSVRKLLVIVNDGTRPTPTATFLQSALESLRMCDVTFLVATGAHRASHDHELLRIFGDCYVEFKDRIAIHDARDESSLRFFGTTSFGTEIYFNELVAESDGIVVVGSVEPHYFAGFTGGRKGLLPGVSGFRTIEQNHKLALSESAYAMNLDDNPVHLDMIESLQFLSEKSLFGIMAVLDDDHAVAFWTGGLLDDAFTEAAIFAKNVFGIPIKHTADLVITVAKAPMDINLYQTQKALDNASLAVSDGGAIILISPCHEGIGDDEFATLLSLSESPEGVLQNVSNTYLLGYHKAAKMAQIFMRARVYAYSRLDEDMVTSLFMHPIDTIQKVIDRELKTLEHQPRVYIMPDGGMTIPVFV